MHAAPSGTPVGLERVLEQPEQRAVHLSFQRQHSSLRGRHLHELRSVSDRMTCSLRESPEEPHQIHGMDVCHAAAARPSSRNLVGSVVAPHTSWPSAASAIVARAWLTLKPSLQAKTRMISSKTADHVSTVS